MSTWAVWKMWERWAVWEVGRAGGAYPSIWQHSIILNVYWVNLLMSVLRHVLMARWSVKGREGPALQPTNEHFTFSLDLAQYVDTKAFFAVLVLQSWARDNTDATTWPCFQATELVVITLRPYSYWLHQLETLKLSLFFLGTLMLFYVVALSLSRSYKIVACPALEIMCKNLSSWSA